MGPRSDLGHRRLGGGSLASSRASTDAFYPGDKKGAALGLNAAAATSAWRSSSPPRSRSVQAVVKRGYRRAVPR